MLKRKKKERTGKQRVRSSAGPEEQEVSGFRSMIPGADEQTKGHGRWFGDPWELAQAGEPRRGGLPGGRRRRRRNSAEDY